MKITKNKNGNTLEIALEGRLDTVTAPELEDALKGELKGVTLTRYDMTNLEYVSSAGLRVMLQAHRNMAYGGETVISHASEIVRQVLSVTGFNEVFTIE